MPLSTRRDFLRTAGAGAAAALAGRALGAPRPPNVLIVLADDLGFSDVGCYGGEIATPHLDRLAAGGVRFTQCYNTARCWPTRAGLLTGYYPQQIRMDPIVRGPSPAWARTLPELLRPAGYRAYHSGKWHFSGRPRAVADGGFDHSYKLDDHNHNFAPRQHSRDDQPLPPVEPGSGYYTTTAIADHALGCLREHAARYPQAPFLSYVAFTVPHFPLQAPAADVAKYRDRYLAGWDRIRAERNRRVAELGIVRSPAAPLEAGYAPFPDQAKAAAEIGPGELVRELPWDDLTPEQQRHQATKMAVHAAMVDRMDQEIGRLLDQVRAMGAEQDTVVMFLSDNGASAELLNRGDKHDPTAPPGSAGSFLCLGPGWARTSNAPFRRYKIFVHEGGIATPLIVHWPAGLAARGELRHDPAHIIDLAPTLLDLAGLDPAGPPGDRPPFPGRSLVPAFARNGAVTRESLYFHHSGHRAIRMGDWKATAGDDDQWELYDLAADRTECHNLAAREPTRLQALAARWDTETAAWQRDAARDRPAGGG